MICPNCGEELPDTARMCHICRKRFLRDGEKKTSGDGGKGRILDFNAENSGNTVIYRVAFAPSEQVKKMRLMAAILGMVGACLCVIAVFLPYFSMSLLGTTSSVSLFNDFNIDWLAFVGAAFGVLLITLLDKKNKGIVMTALGLGVTAFNIVESFVNLDNLKKSAYGDLVVRGAGFYMMLTGGILILISGIIFRTAYNKDRI